MRGESQRLAPKSPFTQRVTAGRPEYLLSILNHKIVALAPRPAFGSLNSLSGSFRIENATGGSYVAKRMATLPISKFGENLPVTGIVAVSQAAIGVGVGLLVADKLEINARQRTAIALIGAGAAAVIPFVAGLYERMNRQNASERSMRRRLDSMREDVGFPGSEEIV